MRWPWQELNVEPDGTHHLYRGEPAYAVRFHAVGKFHEPGLAPVRDSSGAYHIDVSGRAAYSARYIRSFGYYQRRAAVQSNAGWLHVLADGTPLYAERYAWSGNYQEDRCAVRLHDSSYLHLRENGGPAYPDRYRYAGDYRDGYAVVQGDDGNHTHIDCDGQLVHGRWFRDLDVFHKGFARACDDDGWHHIDLRGQPLYRRRFKMVEPFYNGQARAEDLDGGLLVIDHAGDTVTQLRPSLKSPLEKLSSDMVGFWRTQAIRAAVELGVFEALPSTAGELERRLGLAISCGARLLRALQEVGLVCPGPDDIWQVTRRGSLLAGHDGPSMADAALLWGQEHYDAWKSLASSLRSGDPALDQLYGEPFFAWTYRCPSRTHEYQRVMGAYARHDYADLAELVDLSGHKAVIDAGGGLGELLFQLLRVNPHLQGILLDLPEVIDGVEAPGDLSARCELAAGDLFAPWPVRGDAIVLARVLHDWSDDEAVRILREAGRALAPTGRVYVLERLLVGGCGSGGMLDLNMLVMTGGRERTLPQLRELLEQAGFKQISECKMRVGLSVVIAGLG